MPSIRSILLVVGVPALLLAAVLYGVELLEGQWREALIGRASCRERVSECV